VSGPVRLYTLDGKCNLSGERIQQARIRARLSQEQLAGKRLVPDFELPIIAQALGVTTDWLLGKEEMP